MKEKMKRLAFKSLQSTDTQQSLSDDSDSELTNRTHPRPRRQASSVVSRHEFFYPPNLSEQQFNSSQDHHSSTQFSQHSQYSHHIHHSRHKQAQSQSQQAQKLVSPPPSPAVPIMSAKATRKRRQVESDLVLPSNSRRKATMTIEPTKTYEKTSRAKALGGGGIKHVYTEDQDRFLAEILADDHINLIIQGKHRRHASTPKCKIHQELAIDFNVKFGTHLDGLQIKNKIANMQKIWKDASKYRNTSIRGRDDDQALRIKVMRRCNFYYIVEPTWSPLWVPPPHLPSPTIRNPTIRNPPTLRKLQIGPGPINQTEVVEPEPGQGPEQEPELEPIHDLEEVEDEPEHENEAENEPEIDEIQSESDFPIIEHDIRATGKQKSDHYQSTSAYQPRMMENMDELELDSRSRHEVEKAGEGITEQELTKRVVAEYSQTTKREEFRIGLERDKERTKQLELENKQLELRLKIEQARFERIRLETDRERQQGRSFSLD